MLLKISISQIEKTFFSILFLKKTFLQKNTEIKVLDVPKAIQESDIPVKIIKII